MKHWPFEIVEAGKKPKIQVEFKCEKKTFTPEEVSSMVSFEQIPEIFTIKYSGDMCQKCEGNCGLWVFNEILKKHILKI